MRAKKARAQRKAFSPLYVDGRSPRSLLRSARRRYHGQPGKDIFHPVILPMTDFEQQTAMHMRAQTKRNDYTTRSRFVHRRKN